MVSYAQMGRALVTGILEERGHRWSEWRRDGREGEQLDVRTWAGRSTEVDEV